MGRPRKFGTELESFAGASEIFTKTMIDKLTYSLNGYKYITATLWGWNSRALLAPEAGEERERNRTPPQLNGASSLLRYC